MCITEIRNLLALNGRSVKGPSPHSQNRQESHAKTHFPMDVLHFYQNIKQKVLSCCFNMYFAMTNKIESFVVCLLDIRISILLVAFICL